MIDEAKRELNRQKAKQYRLGYRLNGPTVHHAEKQCCRCKEIKPIDEFALNKSAADWRATKCRSCAGIARDEWRKKNPERARTHSLEQAARDRLKPKDERNKYHRKWYLANKEIQHERTRQWFSNNKEKRNAWMRNYVKERKLRDPAFAFSEKVRNRIRLLMRGYRKSAPTEKLLGCSIKDFRKYLELRWEPWMSWENYGHWENGWVIDHIVPVEAFDLSNPDDQRCCFHFSNLRPLCSKQNRDKWHKFDPASLDDLRKRVLCLGKSSLHPPKD